MNARLVFNDTEPAIPTKLIVIDGRYKMMDSLNNLLQFMTSMFAVNCSLFDWTLVVKLSAVIIAN